MDTEMEGNGSTPPQGRESHQPEGTALDIKQVRPKHRLYVDILCNSGPRLGLVS